MPKGKPRHLLLEAFFCAICLAFASWFAGDQNVLFTAVTRQLVHVCHKEVHERQESSRKPKKAQDSSSILGCLLAGLTQLRLLGFPVGDLSKDKAEISPVFDSITSSLASFAQGIDLRRKGCEVCCQGASS